jgi:hypothetical protein
MLSLLDIQVGRELDLTRNELLNELFPNVCHFFPFLVLYYHARSSPFPSPFRPPRLSIRLLSMPTRSRSRVSPTLRIMGVTRLAQNPHPPPKLARYSPDIYSPRFIPALGAAISPPPGQSVRKGTIDCYQQNHVYPWIFRGPVPAL